MGRFIELTGRACRALPTFRGKTRLAGMLIAPWIRGRGHRAIVPLSAPGGGRLICEIDDWIPWNVFLHGRYHVERNYENVMLSMAAGCRTILDVGANIGYYAVQFARIIGSSGHVHAFEPMSYQHRLLTENIELNGIDNISVNKVIISSAPGRRRIYFAGMGNTGSSSLESVTGQHEDVESITLDAYCERKQIERIDLIKIDVEGHEMEVLTGLEAMLREGRVGSLFMEILMDRVVSDGLTARNLVSYLARFGYEPSSIATGRMEPYSGTRTESLVLFRRADSRPHHAD